MFSKSKDLITSLIIILIILIIRTQVSKYLERKLLNRKVNTIANPFFIKKGKIGILMIHGFSSAPIDLQALGQFLAKKNITEGSRATTKICSKS